MYNLNNIKTLAAEKKVSMKQIFAYCDISEGGFYKSIENQSMNIKTIDKIAQLLKVSVSELINDSNAKKSECREPNFSLVSTPIEIYEPPTSLVELYKIMYEQQKEIADQQKEITDLKVERERLKKDYAIEKNAKAG